MLQPCYGRNFHLEPTLLTSIWVVLLVFVVCVRFMIDTAHLQPHHVPAFGGTICQWDLRAVCLRILRYRLRLRSAFALSICAFQRLGIAFGLCACAKPSETKKRHFYAQPCTIYLSFMTYELSKSYPQLKQDSISWRTYIFQFPENRHFDERSLELSNAGKKTNLRWL